MPHARPHKRKMPKRVLALPDLEHAKSAVLSSLTSQSGQRTYDHAIRQFVAWYCSEPRLAFNRTVVLRYRIHLEQRQYAPATINLRLAAVRRVAYEAADAGLLSPELAAGIRRVKGVRRLGVRLGNWLTPEQGRRLLEHSQSATPRELRDHAMLAMLIGCGLRRGELLALTLESIQQREQHWVIADLVGKGGHVRTAPSRSGSSPQSTRGRRPQPSWRAACFGPSTRLGGSGATGCRRKCCGMSSEWRQRTPASGSWHRTIFAARARGCVTWRVANSSRSSSSWATSPSRRRSGTWDANRSSGAP